MNQIRIQDTTIQFYNIDEKTPMINDTKSQCSKYSHYGWGWRCINLLKKAGFEIVQSSTDPFPGNTTEIYTAMLIGHKDHLKFTYNRYPAGFEFTFYQDIHTQREDQQGYYEFNKYEQLPYLQKLMFQKYSAQLIDLMITSNDDSIQIEKDPARLSPEDAIIYDHNRSWHHSKTINKLSEIDGEKPSDSSNFANGSIKYFRDEYSGRIQRGKIYHNINNMWWIITGPNTRRNIADHNLLDFSQIVKPHERIVTPTPQATQKHNKIKVQNLLKRAQTKSFSKLHPSEKEFLFEQLIVN